jgi:hypothetical protein
MPGRFKPNDGRDLPAGRLTFVPACQSIFTQNAHAPPARLGALRSANTAPKSLGAPQADWCALTLTLASACWPALPLPARFLLSTNQQLSATSTRSIIKRRRQRQQNGHLSLAGRVAGAADVI